MVTNKWIFSKIFRVKGSFNQLFRGIFPKYQEPVAIIKTSNQLKHSLTADLYRQGDALHREINTILQRKQLEIDGMDVKHKAAIDKHEAVIYKRQIEIKQVILDLKCLLGTSNVDLVSKYRSRIAEFRKLPPKLRISYPNFLPQKINRDELRRKFRSFTRLSIETEEQGYTVPSPGAESSLPARPLLDVSRIITNIHIPTRLCIAYYHQLNISCLSDKHIWTSGDNKIMELYNLQGHILDSVQIKSGINPHDIAVTRS